MRELPKLLIMLKLLGGAYVLFVAIMSFLAIRTAPRKVFGPLLLIASVTPFILLWSVCRAFFPNKKAVPAYNPSAAAIEDKIEAKRVALYGGSTIEPSFSEMWRNLHHANIQVAVQETVSTAKKILNFGDILPRHS